MSLINNMLNDLQGRDALYAVKDGSVINDLNASEELIERRKPNLSLIILISLLLISSYLLYHHLQIDFENIFQALQKMEPVNLENETYEGSNQAYEPADPDQAQDELLQTNQTQLLMLKLDNLNSGYSEQTTSTLEPVAVSDGVIDIDGVTLEKQENDWIVNLKINSYPDYNVYILDNPHRLMVEIKGLTDNGTLSKTDYDSDTILRLRPVYKKNIGILVFDLNKTAALEDVSIDEINSSEFNMQLTLAPRKTAIADNNKSIEDKPASETIEVNQENSIKKISKSNNSIKLAETTYNEGISAYKSGDVARAIDLLYGLLMVEPLHIEARTTLTAILMQQGDRDSAKILLQEGLKSVGDNLAFIKIYARMLYEEGDLTNALELLNRISPDIASNQDYYAMKAAILQRNENYEQANEVYSSLIKIDSNNSTWWAGYGITLEALGRRDEALRIYKRIGNDKSISPEIAAYISQRLNLVK